MYIYTFKYEVPYGASSRTKNDEKNAEDIIFSLRFSLLSFLHISHFYLLFTFLLYYPGERQSKKSCRFLGGYLTFLAKPYYRVRPKKAGKSKVLRGEAEHQVCVLQMDKSWYTNESVWSLSFSYPDLQEDLEKKKNLTSIFSSYFSLLSYGARSHTNKDKPRKARSSLQVSHLLCRHTRVPIRIMVDRHTAVYPFNIVRNRRIQLYPMWNCKKAVHTNSK